MNCCTSGFEIARRSVKSALFTIMLTVALGSLEILNARQIMHSIGDEYGGGIVACIFQPGDSGYVEGEQHGLIISQRPLTYTAVFGQTKPNTADFSYNELLTKENRFRWSTSVTDDASSPHYAYKKTGTLQGFGTGRTNTIAILGVYPKSIYKYTAAAMCDNYTVTVGGITYDDWYLPSREELDRLSKNHDNFDGTFVYNNVFWSSSEESPTASWNNYFVRFGAGVPDNVSKSGSSSIRAVRAF